MSSRAKLSILAIVSIISLYAGYRIGANYSSKTEIEQVEVEKLVEKEKVVTKIVERPDGSKETIITENRGKVATKDKKRSEVKIEAYKPKWRLGVQTTLLEQPPIFGGSISRRVLGDLWVGVYARTDREVGVLVSYDF